MENESHHSEGSLTSPELQAGYVIPADYLHQAEMESAQPNEIRDEYLAAVERLFLEQLQERTPKIPRDQRTLGQLTSEQGQAVAEIEQIRPYQHPTRWGGDQKLVVVDFDDVINYTTTFNDYVEKFCVETFSIDSAEFKQLYESSKMTNPAGKKVLRFEQLLIELERRYPGAKEKVNAMLQATDYNQFVDQGVKRALLSIKGDPENRVVVLTYGDRDYQRMRINGTDLDRIVDDVIYTEGSKRDVIEALMRRDYGPGGHAYQNPPYEGAEPFVFTVDDSTEHVDDYIGLHFVRNYVNIQYHHPQAKRYGREASDQQAVGFRETLPHQAAVDLFKAVDITNSQYALRDRAELHRFFNQPAAFDAIRRRLLSSNMEYDIRYSRTKQGEIIKKWKSYEHYEDYGTPVLRDELVNRKEQEEALSINSHGLPVYPNGRRLILHDATFNYDEFIRSAMPAPKQKVFV